MKQLKNLTEVPIEEQRDFVNSFEHIFCDMDGVIWHRYHPLPGAQDCLEFLKKIGKKLTFVTNNGLNTVATMKSKLTVANFDTSTEIVNPIIAITEYLKQINFDKTIFAIGTTQFKDEFKRQGFTLAPDPPLSVKEDLNEFMRLINDRCEVGAVIIDFDVNINRLKLQRAIEYLKRPDCLFIAGACDKELPLGVDIGPLIGNHHFFRALADVSGREYLQLSKPSPQYLEFLTDRLGIQNSKKILVIGDSIPSDMGLAAAAGYQKLLVLTGTATPDDILNWRYSEDLVPNYYIDSLDAFKNVLEDIYK